MNIFPKYFETEHSLNMQPLRLRLSVKSPSHSTVFFLKKSRQTDQISAQTNWRRPLAKSFGESVHPPLRARWPPPAPCPLPIGRHKAIVQVQFARVGGPRPGDKRARTQLSP
jgi:hypothetical protein